MIISLNLKFGLIQLKAAFWTKAGIKPPVKGLRTLALVKVSSNRFHFKAVAVQIISLGGKFWVKETQKRWDILPRGAHPSNLKSRNFAKSFSVALYFSTDRTDEHSSTNQTLHNLLNKYIWQLARSWSGFWVISSHAKTYLTSWECSLKNCPFVNLTLNSSSICAPVE